MLKFSIYKITTFTGDTYNLYAYFQGTFDIYRLTKLSKNFYLCECKLMVLINIIAYECKSQITKL